MKQDRYRKAGLLLFVLYLILLIHFLFFSEGMGRTAQNPEFAYNLVPFREIRRFIVHWEKLGLRVVLINLLGNVLAFVPFGFFVPVLLPKARRICVTAALGLAASAFVEVLQLLSRVGSFDVDDLILNTAGILLGYLIFLLARRMGRRFIGAHRE